MLEGVRLVLDQGQKVKATAKELGLNYKTPGSLRCSKEE